jgi:sugar phosphate isomerase/epimerase
MKLSFNTWVYSSFPVWVPAYTLEETIRRIAGIGYDGIEIGAAAPHAYPSHLNKDRRKAIKRILDDNGIAVSSMLPAPGGGPGFNVASPLEEERREAVDQYKQVIELCSDLGGPTVMYIAGWQIYGTSRIQAWDWSREALSEIADVVELGILQIGNQGLYFFCQSGHPGRIHSHDVIERTRRGELSEHFLLKRCIRKRVEVELDTELRGEVR